MYKRTNWVSGKTPLSADNLNNIEDLLESISNSAFYLGEDDNCVEVGTYQEWVNKGMPKPQAEILEI